MYRTSSLLQHEAADGLALYTAPQVGLPVCLRQDIPMTASKGRRRLDRRTSILSGPSKGRGFLSAGGAGSAFGDGAPDPAHEIKIRQCSSSGRRPNGIRNNFPELLGLILPYRPKLN